METQVFELVECVSCGAKHKMLKTPKRLKHFDIYSDGKTVSSELSDALEVTRCLSCNSFFWIDDAKSYTSDEAMGDIPMIVALNVEEYISLLNDDSCFKTTDEEEILRRELLWAFNDRIRNGKQKFENDLEQAVWRENMNVLLKLLDETDVFSRLQRAEIAREIGEFELALKILNGIKDASLYDIKKQMINAINHKEVEVLKFE